MSRDVVEEIYQGRIVSLRIERVSLPNGAEIDLEVVRHKGAAAVAAVDDQDRVVLIRQYRYAAGGFIWEVPAGILKSDDEPPAACAVRELREEVGLTAREWTQLGSIFTTPGFADEQIHLFLARGLQDVGHARDHDEVIDETRSVPVGEALAMVRRGEIVDGKTVACLYLAADALRVTA
jgi:8-oxo-dGTP pyrophosphatase MutT (NUDIX family)